MTLPGRPQQTQMRSPAPKNATMRRAKSPSGTAGGWVAAGAQDGAWTSPIAAPDLWPQGLEMKAVAHFHVDLAGIGIMRSAKGIALVEQVSAVGNVEGIYGEGPVFSNRHAQ